MDMPKPTEHHQELSAFVGKWQGDETLFPSPWAPEQRSAIGRFSARMGLDGMYLVSDYEEERDGAVIFRGHGVYGYDAVKGKYTMYWFDSMGFNPVETLGTWTDNTLTFEASSDHGKSRYVYELNGADRYMFRILMSRDGVEWAPMMEGAYTRVP